MKADFFLIVRFSEELTFENALVWKDVVLIVRFSEELTFEIVLAYKSQLLCMQLRPYIQEFETLVWKD